jgi:hypothetical protein
MEKMCGKCKILQPLDNFCKDRWQRDGRRSVCRSCTSRKKPKSPPRKGWVENGIGYIPLTQDQVAKVDPKNVEYLSQWEWFAYWSPNSNSFYAARKGKNKEQIKMHRQIAGVNDDVLIDHHDHDTLNNQEYNIRPATRIQNAQNARIRKDNTSGFKGVHYRSDMDKYVARIQTNGRRRFLGYRDTPEEAAALYIEAAKEEHKEFAYLGGETK